MLEFKTTQELKPNPKLLELIKDFNYKTKSKELNPIEWTKLMNNYKSMAEEIVLNEYVFCINNLQKKRKKLSK